MPGNKGCTLNRAFISLYAFIVASVILLGWGLNSLWDTLSPEVKVSNEIYSLFSLLEKNLETGNENKLVELLQEQDAEVQLILLEDVANSDAFSQLKAGEIVIGQEDGRISYYKIISPRHQLLVVSFPLADSQSRFIYKLLLIIFYVGMALAIFLWVWPLSRDAQRLERQTYWVGKDGVPEILQITPTSTLYPLARAFNQMTQRLRELIASHREMTNAVSHELRTPLARMKFALAMLDGQVSNPKAQEHLQGIAEDIHDMESLISSLLVYAGFERHTQELQLREGQMHDLLETIRERFIREGKHHLHMDIVDLSQGVACMCEWKLMETAVQNLVNNAARYATSCIRIEYGKMDKEWYLLVEDDGPGIPLEQRERIFDSFVRLYHTDGEGESQSSGFGLGLAIVKRIMQWHKGQVRAVDPQILSGARIELYWPDS